MALASRLWNEGLTLAQIGARLGRSVPWVKARTMEDRAAFPRRRAQRAVLSKADIIARGAPLWRDGMAARDIAAELDITFGTLIGFAARNRAEFPARGTAADRAKQADARWKGDGRRVKEEGRKKTLLPSSFTLLPFPDAPEPRLLTLAALGAGECKWPVNDWEKGRGEEARFCGAPAAGGSWCAFHAGKAVTREAGA